jgi:hypothetical protein
VEKPDALALFSAALAFCGEGGEEGEGAFIRTVRVCSCAYACEIRVGAEGHSLAFCGVRGEEGGGGACTECRCVHVCLCM